MSDILLTVLVTVGKKTFVGYIVCKCKKDNSFYLFFIILYDHAIPSKQLSSLSKLVLSLKKKKDKRDTIFRFKLVASMKSSWRKTPLPEVFLWSLCVWISAVTTFFGVKVCGIAAQLYLLAGKLSEFLALQRHIEKTWNNDYEVVKEISEENVESKSDMYKKTMKEVVP